jgi:hypothetical protein
VDLIQSAARAAADAHAALVSHGDGIAAQLVEVTRLARVVLDAEGEGTMAYPNAVKVSVFYNALADLRSYLDATRALTPPPGDTTDGKGTP